jgi:UDP-N-acetylmuramoylalanine--D-glutamate ligase
MKIKELKNKKIAILGYGKEWKSTENFLKKININNYKILDKNIDSNYLSNLEDFDVIFKSPWISPYNNPELQKNKNKLISQAEILADNFDWRIIWITWTKGKSTTSTLLYEILKELGYKVKLVWNIWNSVLDEVDLISEEKYDYLVYELSSYMLEWLELNIFVWLLNNIYDCHLDWHNWRKNYENAKFNIFKNAQHKLVSSELENIGYVGLHTLQGLDFFGLDWRYHYKNNAFYIGEKEILKDENIALNWEHNRKNISGIIWILDKIGVIKKLSIEGFIPLKKVLSEFTGLAHRQENIWTYKWITFINDSIASTPESAIAAIKTFWEKISTVFIWNEDSGFDLTELRKIIEKYKIPNIILFPTTWEKLFWEFSKNMEFEKEIRYVDWNFETNLFKTLSMEEAVKFSYKNWKEGDVVLLSTWAPSFNADWPWIMPWKSFEEKWELFKRFVEKYSK